ncbi:MAG TPA: NAD(P)/FAD-dependent oxidoreductase [Verrucomicrobiales bacterium]|nr:NAD(P)/FAD-dependent oxidoreductase [Verrucomicrobiales bacterium]
MEPRRRVVVIGGGFAGLACAQELAGDDRFAVTLIDRRNHHLFQPLLYQVATAALAAPDIARTLRGVLSRGRNVGVVLDEIIEIDLEGREVRSRERTYAYDYLVVAAGAQTSYFGNDEWGACATGLKSLEDAQAIRARVLSALERAEICEDEEERRRLMTIVIVGGGPTGVELAGAFSDLVRRAMKSDFRRIDPAKLRIVLVEASERVLEGFAPGLSEYAADHLGHLGVEVRTGRKMVTMEPGRMQLSDGEVIAAETIIWAAGVRSSPLTGQLQCERDRGGRVKVKHDLSLPGHPEVFAAGDLVFIEGPDGKPAPGLAPAAQQMGLHIARVVKEDLRRGRDPSEGRRAESCSRFYYLDKGMMAIIGKNAAVMQAGKLRLRGFPAWVAWLFIHILFLIGFRNKLAVLLQWAWAYVADKPGARVITGRPDRG